MSPVGTEQRWIRAALVAACMVGCGAKTGLLVPAHDASVDRVDVQDVRDVVDATDVPVVVDDVPSYLGTEFWAVSTANGMLNRGNYFHFAVAVGNPNADAVNVTIDRGEGSRRWQFVVPAHSTITQTLPWVTEIVQNSAFYVGCYDRPDWGRPARSAFVPLGAYHVTTSEPVSVYQFNPLEFEIGNLTCSPRSYTNDASLLLPAPTLTGNYMVLTHNSFGSAGSFVAITGAGHDPVTVDVTPSANVRDGNGVEATPAGTIIHRILMPGDVLQLVSEAGSEESGYGDDLTGSIIRANGPVSVFAGVDCTNMSWPDGSLMACDHLEEQLTPLETWGSSAVVTQLRDRAQDERYMVRILSRDDGNRLAFTPATAHDPITLRRGEYVEFESTEDFLVSGSSPLMVAQYMEGQDTTIGSAMGDPAMVFEVPVEQFRQRYEFVVPASYTRSFINVVSRAGAVVWLDSAPMDTAPDPIGTTPWVVRRSRVAPGSHSLVTDDASGLGLKVIGIANYTSYMYPGGLNLVRR